MEMTTLAEMRVEDQVLPGDPLAEYMAREQRLCQCAANKAPGSVAALHRDEVSILSPLRYPGSKRRLGGYIKETLKINGLRPALLVEPFAGGASVCLQLLNDGAVDQIGLIDKDPLVAAF